MKKRIVALLAVLLLTVLMAGCSGRNAAFGYVDMQKVMQESPKVKELRTQMDNKMKELQATEEKDKTTLKGDELAKKQQANSAEMQAFGSKIEEQFQTSLNTAIDEVSKEKNLGAVLAKGSVLHGGTDVTDEVIKRMK